MSTESNNLGGNKVGDEGAKHMIQFKDRLIELRLVDCGIREEGVKFLS